MKEENSPTRGLHRDDGQRLFLEGTGVKQLQLSEIKDLEKFIKSIPKDVAIVTKNKKIKAANLGLKTQ